MTTGSLPPVSDQGKSFVHDPKLEGSTSTKAQIRLTFRTHNDAQAVLALRSFQLTQSANSRQFKALEGVLKVKQLSNGTERSVSHKCVDMDKMVPQMMGVSAAVLENVIFCHQSESDWPLSDSKALKLKFDDIFSATRYTKALDVLHKLKNEKKASPHMHTHSCTSLRGRLSPLSPSPSGRCQASVKLLEAELKVVDTQQQHAKKLSEERTSTEQAITANRDKRARIEEECAALEADVARYSGQVAELNAIRAKVKEKEMLIAVLTDERKRAYEKMRTEVTESDEFCRTFQVEQQRRQTELLASIVAQEERSRQLHAHVEDNDRDYQESVKQIGKYEQQMSELQSRRQDLHALRSRLTDQYHVQCAGEDADGREADFLTVMQRVLERHRDDLRSHKSMVAKVDSGFEDSVAGLKARDVKVTEQLIFRRQTASKTVNRIKELVQRNKDIDSAVDLDDHVARSEEVAELERKLNQDGDISGEPGEGGADDPRMLMAEKQRHLNAADAELLVLRDERKKLSNQSDALVAVRVRQSQLAAQVNKHNQALSALLSASHDIVDLSLPPVVPLPSAPSQAAVLQSKEHDSGALHGFFVSEHRAVKAELRTRSDEHSGHGNAVSRLNGQLKLLKDELAAIDPAVERIKKEFASPPASDADVPAIHLAEYRDAAAYDGDVLGLQARLDKLNAEKARHVVTLEVLEKYRAKYAEERQCPFCTRGFGADDERSRFETRLSSMIDEVKELVEGDKFERKITQARRRMKRMQELAPRFHEYLRLNVVERDAIKAKVEATQRQVDDAELKAEETEARVKKLTRREQRLAELITASDVLRRLHLEIVDAVKSIESERTKARAAQDGKDGGARELETVVRELEEREKTRSRLQADVSALQERVNAAMKRREDVTRRYHAVKSALADTDKMMDEKAKNDAEVLKLRATWQEDKDESDRLTAQQLGLRDSIAKQEREREEQRKKNAEGEARLQSSVSELQREVDAFSKALDSVASLTAEMSSGRGLTTPRELYAKANALKAMREERDNGLKNLNGLKEKLSECQSDLSDVAANLDYRKRQYDIAQHQKDLTTLQQQLGAMGLDTSALNQAAQAEKRLERLHAKASEIKGALAQLQKYADDRTKDLQAPLYRDVQQRYAGALIDLHTNVMACKDLDTYARVLDVSLMHYHTVKMREINELLRDYWRSIYRGTDIEEIYIHSAVETESNRRRNYHYSVMMRQGDTDLEMRGRCSAGQRVLASLLIRLALADTFCIQAGFIALDEPTTNLDAANIAAFAAALADIVEKRRRQSNFQLIVITHDEKFVEEMGRAAGVEEYWRIVRDPHTHYSRIKREKWNSQERED